MVLTCAAGLFGRLRCLLSGTVGQHRTIACQVFQYARCRSESWASWASQSLQSWGVPSEQLWGIGPGQPRAALQCWPHQAVALSIQSVDVNRIHVSGSASNSLTSYMQVQPSPCLQTRVHNGRVDASDAREWGLARCGHHPFSDGRSHRHRSQSGLVCPL